MTTATSVVAFAGRRIDAQRSLSPRFPSENLARVERDLAAFFDARPISTVVGSAACGADILILEAARERRIRTHIILPFAAERFRETSVIDRGPDWGPRYDLALGYALQHGRLIVIPQAAGSDEDAYARVTEAIFAEAQQLGREFEQAPVALAVWDRNPRSSTDATWQFLAVAMRTQFECVEVPTL